MRNQKPTEKKAILLWMLYGLSLSFFLYGAMSFINLQRLSPQGILREEAGTLTRGQGKRSKEQVIGAEEYRCLSGCLYAGMNEDIGKPVVVVVDERNIVFELRSRGKTRITAERIKAREARSLQIGVVGFMALFGVALILQRLNKKR